MLKKTSQLIHHVKKPNLLQSCLIIVKIQAGRIIIRKRMSGSVTIRKMHLYTILQSLVATELYSFAFTELLYAEICIFTGHDVEEVNELSESFKVMSKMHADYISMESSITQKRSVKEEKLPVKPSKERNWISFDKPLFLIPKVFIVFRQATRVANYRKRMAAIRSQTGKSNNFQGRHCDLSRLVNKSFTSTL